ncbi:hypothetical protein INR49_006723 [Caranx melampygus]|nr:hypothetical protein INR49_006812 [Caranx melampygus]KAG7233686.1 hypothetical protein INR49_006723 [Caranx melampygus]
MIPCSTLGVGGGECAGQWRGPCSVMSQRYKAPHCPAACSEQSQRSRPGRLGWRDCCQEETELHGADGLPPLGSPGILVHTKVEVT